MNKIKSTVLSSNDKNSQQIVLQACIPFLELKNRAQFGYRISPIDNPYTSFSFNTSNQYQRRIDDQRIAKIVDYLKKSILKNQNGDSLSVIFPTAMLLAFDYDDEISIVDNTFELNLPPIFYIVDGQHRLGSMIKLYDKVKSSSDSDSIFIKNFIEKYRFNCTLLMNFDMWEQAQIFADVNFNQKSVSKSLYYDIYGMEYSNDSSDNLKNAMYISHKVIEELNNNQNSALSGFIKMLGTGKGYVSQSCFADALIPSIQSPMGNWYVNFDEYYGTDRIPSFNHISSEVMSFFNAVAETFPKLWPSKDKKAPSILCKTTGIQALVKFMGYLHQQNSKKVRGMFCRNNPIVTINNVYMRFAEDYLNLFVGDQEKLFGLKESGGRFSGTGGKGLANQLYVELIRIVMHQNMSDYLEWLVDNLDPSDFDNIYDLYLAVDTLNDYGMYSAREDDDRIIVSHKHSLDGNDLVLEDNRAKIKFLKYLDDTYGGDIGILSLWDFKREMEKDD